MTMPTDVTIYFDYLCPFAYRGVRLLTEMERKRPDVRVSWRHFSLEQVNARRENQAEDWKLWEQPLDYEGFWGKRSRMLAGFLASHAASLQGQEAFARFRLALYNAYHNEEADPTDPELLLDVARQAELDLTAFENEWQSQNARDRLRDDYLRGREAGAFGVPTLIIDGCEASYIRISQYPPEAERDEFFDELVHALCERPYLQEIKRASAG